MNEYIGKGSIASQGALEGLIQKIDDALLQQGLDFTNFEDKILVAPYTTPDYMPYILACKGIITSTGGILSHSAIISRELNIPCIVGAQGIYDILNNNDEVRGKKDGSIYKIST